MKVPLNNFDPWPGLCHDMKVILTSAVANSSVHRGACPCIHDLWIGSHPLALTSQPSISTKAAGEILRI